ncbi:MAG: hypothetical protein AB9922_08485 [Bacteroidales bacterium]
MKKIVQKIIPVLILIIFLSCSIMTDISANDYVENMNKKTLLKSFESNMKKLARIDSLLNTSLFTELIEASESIIEKRSYEEGVSWIVMCKENICWNYIVVNIPEY